MRRKAVLATLGLALAWCAVGRPAAAQPQPEVFELVTADSVRIAAFWYARSNDETAPVALLLHNPGSRHEHWNSLITPLYRAGFQILAPDLRGHGQSKELAPDVYAEMRRRNRQPYLDMIHDVEAAIAWLTQKQEVPPERIAVVGGEHCANLTIQAFSRNPDLGAGIAMSPAKNYFNAPLLEWAEGYGNRPLYIIIPKQYLGRGASDIAEVMRDNPGFKMKVFPVADLHGVRMLGLSWNVETLIVDWLTEVFGLES
ncbi:MAG: alpha/beta fold hydrolase [Candidatus Latescibacterota bacterium]|nr:MAG: alpha/beta fold hydrolase [Candidatus Latescibacterota bacterium]